MWLLSQAAEADRKRDKKLLKVQLRRDKEELERAQAEFARQVRPLALDGAAIRYVDTLGSHNVRLLFCVPGRGAPPQPGRSARADGAAGEGAARRALRCSRVAVQCVCVAPRSELTRCSRALLLLPQTAKNVFRERERLLREEQRRAVRLRMAEAKLVAQVKDEGVPDEFVRLAHIKS